MCLRIWTLDGDTWQDHVKTAEKDITVYKVVQYNGMPGFYTSLYWSFKYEDGKTYRFDGIATWPDAYIREVNNVHHIIEKGFHSYISEQVAFGEMKHVLLDVYSSMTYAYRLRVIECKIPAGSKYIYGNDFDVISDNLAVVSEIPFDYQKFEKKIDVWKV